MRRLAERIALIWTCLAIAGCASDPRPREVLPTPATPPLLETLRAAAREGESLDFWELRDAFSRSAAYAPYGHTELDELEEEVSERLDAGDPAALRPLTDRMVELSPLHPKAHLFSHIVATKLGDVEAAEFHDWVLAGLLESICGDRSGDFDAPCPVIATYEEYFYLHAHGLRVVEQGLHECGADVSCDRMTVEDRTGGQYVIFFDISRPMAFLARKFED